LVQNKDTSASVSRQFQDKTIQNLPNSQYVFLRNFLIIETVQHNKSCERQSFGKVFSGLKATENATLCSNKNKDTTLLMHTNFHFQLKPLKERENPQNVWFFAKPLTSSLQNLLLADEPQQDRSTCMY